MFTRLTKAAILIFSVTGLAACNLPGFPTRDGGISHEAFINTAAAQTVAALTTRVSGTETPAPAGVPTLTRTSAAQEMTQAATSANAPGLTVTPTSSIPCNRAEFVDDVTVQDGAWMPPDSRFVKKWALKNVGSCTWDSNYAVVFAGRGTAMTDQNAFPLVTEGEVRPGETVHATVTLTSPRELGTYRGYWMLRAPDNRNFGIGENGASPFYTEIEVIDHLYSFVEHACEAEWRTGAGPLDCPGRESDSQGYVTLVTDPVMEDNVEHEGPGLITLAEPVPGGTIVGKYPPVTVPSGTDFRADISCKPGATGCYVRFKVTYQVDNGPEQVLGEWNEGYEGQTNRAIRDLDMLEGQLVTFSLYLDVNGTPNQSIGIWLNPRITR